MPFPARVQDGAMLWGPVNIVAADGSYVHVWKDRAGEWRWTKHAANHKAVASSGEGYVRRNYAIKKAREIAGLVEN